MCATRADYANPIEPSSVGGEKIARVIVGLVVEPGRPRRLRGSLLRESLDTIRVSIIAASSGGVHDQPGRTAACALAGIVLGFGALAGWPSAAAGAPTLSLFDFEVVRVAGPPLVERPIVADFDQDGRLYVAESSGSNAKVEQQLAERPHRVLRLEDVDGDGVFDRRCSPIASLPAWRHHGVVYGSLYVAAPPSIWKPTDTDADGVADVREEWFQGKTLIGAPTTCTGRISGPTAGSTGRRLRRADLRSPPQPPLVTKAAHVFRRRPGETAIETVLTGGMDNPVDVAFTTTGDRPLTATFLEIHSSASAMPSFTRSTAGSTASRTASSTGTRGPAIAGAGLPPGPSAPSGLTHATGTGFIQPGRRPSTPRSSTCRR